MKRFLIWMAVIGGILIIFIGFVYVFIDALLDTEPVVSRNSCVYMNIGGSIPEYNVPDIVQEYVGSGGLNMQKIRQGFTMAAADKRIEGIQLNIGFLQTGFAKLEELRQLIQTFRESGKKVIAHLDFALTRDYLLASACDSVFLQPGGTIFLSGLAVEITFYKDFFKKIGVRADFEHIGEYKNAPDIYTRSGMNKNMRDEIDEILDFRFEEILKGVSTTRDISVQDLRYLIDHVTAVTPEVALEYKLIDGLRYEDDVKNLFRPDDLELESISVSEYTRLKPQSLGLEKGPRIAIIFCSGAITGGEDGTDPVFGNTMGATRVIRDVNAAVQSSSIKAIVLRIDSPGGSSLASDKIWHAVQAASEKKPVIASISDLGASGGYYIALGADSVVAHRSSLVGSIGIYGGKFSLDSMYQFLGLNTESLQRGQNARIFSLQSTFTEGERKAIRNSLRSFYNLFIERVASGRNIETEKVTNLANGRVWNGENSRSLRLIDEIGGLRIAINLAKELAGIDSTADARLVYYPRKKSLLGQLLYTISGIATVIDNPVKKLEKYIEEIQGRPLALMPYVISYK